MDRFKFQLELINTVAFKGEVKGVVLRIFSDNHIDMDVKEGELCAVIHGCPKGI
jgi:hypothetical protein